MIENKGLNFERPPYEWAEVLTSGKCPGEGFERVGTFQCALWCWQSDGLVVWRKRSPDAGRGLTWD